MKIAILETGTPPEGLEARFGSYPQMFMGMAGRGGRTFEVFDAQACVFPVDPAAWDAVMVTGSPAGAYDPLPWIEPLKGFLREAKGQTRLVGVCFGHQIMAEAFGGQVTKSENGWGIGLHRYDVVASRPWMGEEPPAEISIPVSHQDQVVEQPPASTVLARSRFTPFAALAYDDQPAISFQFHPEFDPAYAAALIERRVRLGQVEEEYAGLALQTLEGANDRALVERWVRGFLTG